ncbi:hypothetical protein Pyn_08056 [Prunus yedoensis var. nudiflora]|uniref:Uncharacterized protein n=1 Tax=Prunus yedoensis var. nudiflora TaxID=2094558 RepID=A0A315A4L2_PRUYE|nr:hypothetical protein Pyn_08056 [Prunus yedoensis var. nudiflora]
MSCHLDSHGGVVGGSHYLLDTSCTSSLFNPKWGLTSNVSEYCRSFIVIALVCQSHYAKPKLA